MIICTDEKFNIGQIVINPSGLIMDADGEYKHPEVFQVLEQVTLEDYLKYTEEQGVRHKVVNYNYPYYYRISLD